MGNGGLLVLLLGKLNPQARGLRVVLLEPTVPSYGGCEPLLNRHFRISHGLRGGTLSSEMIFKCARELPKLVLRC